jgi:hypothetical protein
MSTDDLRKRWQEAARAVEAASAHHADTLAHYNAVVARCDALCSAAAAAEQDAYLAMRKAAQIEAECWDTMTDAQHPPFPHPTEG